MKPCFFRRAWLRCCGLILLSACSHSTVPPGVPSAGGSGAPVRLLIDPANATLAAGESYPYRVNGIYADGSSADVTDRIQWTSADTSIATVDGASVSAVQAGSTTVIAALGSLTAQTPLTVTTFNHVPPPPLPVDFPVKEVDLVAAANPIYGNTEYRNAASQMFTALFRPYYLATSDDQRAAILARSTYTCAEDLDDPAQPGHLLAFPFDLEPARPGTLVWHRYTCTFTLNYTDAGGSAVSYTSPQYLVNQLDVDYGAYSVEPGVAFQNYDFGGAQPDFHYLGRYVQSLDRMLRRRDDSVPLEFYAGVNGGYDFRIDAWSSSTSDNICPARSSPADRHSFYSHPAPAQCPMGDDALPSCAAGDQLPYSDDMGDSLVMLAWPERAKSWRDVPFQSYSCGGLVEGFERGAIALYDQDAYTTRTSANRGDPAELVHGGQRPLSALGAGPLLIRDGHFVYDEAASEEGMPIDNYEIASVTGVGYEHDSGGHLHLHIVVVDGGDNATGLHDWMLGPYFMSPYAHAEGALALGNGGDATFWVHPQTPAVAAVLADASQANHGYFHAVFEDSNNRGIVSNCDFSARPLGCRGRPVHDGLFVRARR
ncbi:MAG TPA: Ig-like domain-containing protein [Nevskiaceae bacterium]|nr:Ig-like domain-containing protein [Nevskiaceae bacterium]